MRIENSSVLPSDANSTYNMCSEWPGDLIFNSHQTTVIIMVSFTCFFSFFALKLKYVLVYIFGQEMAPTDNVQKNYVKTWHQS